MFLLLLRTVFTPIFACLLAPLQKCGWRRTKEGSYGCKMMGIVLLLRIPVVNTEETFLFEKIPGLEV